MTSLFYRRRRRGFLLLETMVGVMVFALGVLALSRCVERCIDSNNAKSWDALARLALENRMAEVEAGALPLDSRLEEKLGGRFAGITLYQTRKPLRLLDEKKKVVTGIDQMDLRAEWREPAGRKTKELRFYVSDKK